MDVSREHELSRSEPEKQKQEPERMEDSDLEAQIGPTINVSELFLFVHTPPTFRHCVIAVTLFACRHFPQAFHIPSSSCSKIPYSHPSTFPPANLCHYSPMPHPFHCSTPSTFVPLLTFPLSDNTSRCLPHTVSHHVMQPL